MKPYRSLCKNKRHGFEITEGVRICTEGCDFRKMRELDRLSAEKRTGLKFDEVYCVLTVGKTRLEFKISGYETPFVRLNGVEMSPGQVEVLQEALEKAADWTENGWCPGSC